LLLATAAAATAQDYPTRPVKIIVPFAAGGPADIYARFIGQRLEAALGQPFIVDDRPGAGSVIGTDAAAKSAPDGYTLLVMSNTQTVNESLLPNKPYALMHDFVPVAPVNYSDLVLVVHPAVPAKTLGELIALAKEHPYKFIIGTNPAGSLPHLAARMFVSLSQAPMTVVPSTGGTNEAIREIMGGRGHAVIEGLPGLVRTAIDAGDLKALAIMTPARVPTAPDIPTAAETLPGLTAVGWAALFAPKGTPQAIVQQLSEDLRKALEDPDYRARFETIGSTPFQAIYSAELARFIESEQKLWWPVVKDAELK